MARKKLGVIREASLPAARRSALSWCDKQFPVFHSPRGLTDNAVCRVSTERSFDLVEGKVGLDGKHKLGLFQNCATQKCKKGFERVVLKKDKDGIPTVCICRLDPDTRKKFRGEEYKVSEEKRKPFGKWKAPVHLRRCVRFDERGRCVKEGRSGVQARDIE